MLYLKKECCVLAPLFSNEECCADAHRIRGIGHLEENAVLASAGASSKSTEEKVKQTLNEKGPKLAAGTAMVSLPHSKEGKASVT